jgi:hypothetical protein
VDDERQSPNDGSLETSGGDGDVHDVCDAHEVDEGTALTPDMEAELPEAGAVPPGYDWPTHGGYLGCLLGMMPACLVGGFLGSTFVAFLNKAGVVPPVVAGLLVAALFVVSVIGFGRIGWVLGRRFYRKYPRAQPTWGEDDSATGTVDSANVVDKSIEGSHTTVNPPSEQTTRQATQ